jgi:hypothetical protein
MESEITLEVFNLDYIILTAILIEMPSKFHEKYFFRI